MNRDKQADFNEIVENIRFEGEFMEAKPYGFGHINDTFAAYFRKKDGTVHRYILQRINHRVFHNPAQLMQNIDSVTRFLREKILKTGGDPERETLNLITARDGGSFYQSKAGDYWRGYVFIENAQTYQTVVKNDHFYHAGRAFGRFQALLDEFPAQTLYETIPDFHHTKKRFAAFVKAVERDQENRAAGAGAEIAFVMKRAEEASMLTGMLDAGKLPFRVTHNDTKFNNVMIDDLTGHGICVIDLDTVMPGSSLYDFGDSIRSGANPAEEDEKDLSKVWMELTLFEQYTRGYLEAVGNFLTPTEIEYLPFAAKLMTFECGMRFLTDYLNGDTYFKVHREGHNLDRTRTQFKMVEDMENKMEQMGGIIKKYI